MCRLEYREELLLPPYQLSALTIDADTDNTITCSLLGIPIRGFLDDGADVCFLKLSLYIQLERCDSVFLRKKLAHPVPVKMGNGTTSIADYAVILPLKIEADSHDTCFLILEDLSHDLILGRSFLRDHRAFRDYGTSELHLPDWGTELTLTHPLTIPAGQTLVTEVQCLLHSQPDHLKPYWPLANRHQIYLSATGQQLSDHRAEVRLSNSSTQSIQLPPGSVVGVVGLNSIETVPSEVVLGQDFDKYPPEPSPPEVIRAILKSKIEEASLDTDQKPSLEKILYNYLDDCFAANPKSPGAATGITHTIELTDWRPVNTSYTPTGPLEKEIIDKQIHEMLTNGIIRVSYSPWASRIVLEDKKDGGLRFCVDYRGLNKLTIKDRYPLSRIDECLAALGGSQCFSVLDLASGYWQIPVRESDKEKTAFICHSGLYEFNCMPFGLTNAPATFQRFMDAVLAGLKWRCVLVYLDDIIIFTKDVETHIQIIQDVLSRLKKHGLHLRADKCYFFKKEISYLGHVVSSEGIRPDPKKVAAISDWPIPTTVKELQSFLGLLGYYRKFIKGYARLTAPLSKLTWIDEPFLWSTDQQTAFDLVKEALTNKPVLVHPDFNQPFILQTDACETGLGAVLCQRIEGQEGVVQYLSRAVRPNERAWSVRELEALAILWACEACRPFLVGTPFIVETDHESLQWLLEAKKPARLVRWALRLSEFDFVIKYRRGRANGNADGLSRRPVHLLHLEVGESETDQLLKSLDLVTEQKKDPKISKILDILKIEPGRYPNLELCQGAVYTKPNDRYLKPRYLVPYHLRESLLRAHHNGNLAAHVGRDRVYQRLQKNYYWPGLYADVENWVNACSECASYKPPKPIWHGKLQPIRAGYPFHIVAMDLVSLQATPRGYRYVLTIIDLFTSWVEAVPLKGITAEEVADAFFKEVITRHCCPAQVLTDRGTQFTSELFQVLCARLGIKTLKISALHAQTNGKCERFHQFLKKALSLLVQRDQNEWDLYLDCVLFAYRTTVHYKVNEVPFFLLYGRDVVLPVDLAFGQLPQVEPESHLEYKYDLVTRLNKAYEELVTRKEKETARYKKYYDSSHKDVKFNVGDLVMVYWPVAKLGIARSLLPTWRGPFKITGQLTPVTFRVEKGRTTLPVHVQRLRKYVPYEATDLQLTPSRLGGVNL